MLFAIVCGQNHMSKKDMMTECKAEKWVPILVMRPDENYCMVPLFQDHRMCYRFAKRNLPPDWICGVIPIEVEWLSDRGWEPLLYGYPHKVKDLTQFDVEILEFEEGAEMQVHC